MFGRGGVEFLKPARGRAPIRKYGNKRIASTKRYFLRRNVYIYI